MIVLTVFAVAYANREFEIPFFPRDAESNMIEIDITRNTAVVITTTEAPTEAPTNVRHILNPEHLAESGEQTGDEPDFPDFADLAAQGYALSGAVYEPYDEAYIYRRRGEIRQMRADIIAEAAENGEPPDFSALPRLYEYKFARVTPAHEPPALPGAVQTVMDYMLIHDGANIILCDASGRIIHPDFGSTEREILRMRDGYGRTVFRLRKIVDTNSGPIIHVEYLIYNAARRAFEEIEFNEALGSMGADFMYPPHFGAPDNNIERFRHTNELWGYRSTVTERNIVNAQYTRAFNFSENIAIAYIERWTETSQVGKRLHFHGADGQPINIRHVNDSFFAPDPIDTETSHLGFYYFEHGLTRVIWRRMNAAGTSTVEQREYLIDTDWREFYTPPDYRIAAYSNGMILLEKDGRYGFMNYLGEWIIQPSYTYAEPFFEGVAVIGMADGKKMLIDTQGNIIVKMQYDHILNCTGGIVALFNQDEGWTILNKMRRVIPID
jgi:hypothetical protein